jgi:hypothetical protein
MNVQLCHACCLLFFTFIILGCATPNPDSYYSAPPIVQAIAFDNKEAFNTLIKSSAESKRKDTSGATPLITAVRRKKIDYVIDLIHSEADINEPDYLGKSPLHIAVNNGDLNLVKLLLAAGADPLRRDYINHTPIYTAIYNDDLEMVKLLAFHGGTEEGSTVFKSNSWEMIEVDQWQKASLNKKTYREWISDNIPEEKSRQYFLLQTQIV